MSDEGDGKAAKSFFKCSLNQIQPRTTSQKSIINHSKGKSGEDGVGSVFPSRFPTTLDDFKLR